VTFHVKRPKVPPLAQIRKAVINGIGLAASLVTLGVLHGRVLLDVNMAIAVLTAVVHYRVPNERPPAEAAAVPPGG
jgi:hypothetical protein